MKTYLVLFCSIGQYYEVLTQEEFQNFEPVIKKSYKIITMIDGLEVNEEIFDVEYENNILFARNIFTGEKIKISA